MYKSLQIYSMSIMIARYYRKAWLYGGGTSWPRQQYSLDSGMGNCVCLCVKNGENEYAVGCLLLWGEGSMCAWRESASVIMHGEHARQPSGRPLCVCLHYVCLP